MLHSCDYLHFFPLLPPSLSFSLLPAALQWAMEFLEIDGVNAASVVYFTAFIFIFLSNNFFCNCFCSSSRSFYRAVVSFISVSREKFEVVGIAIKMALELSKMELSEWHIWWVFKSPFFGIGCFGIFLFSWSVIMFGGVLSSNLVNSFRIDWTVK